MKYKMKCAVCSLTGQQYLTRFHMCEHYYCEDCYASYCALNMQHGLLVSNKCAFCMVADALPQLDFDRQCPTCLSFYTPEDPRCWHNCEDDEGIFDC